MYFFLFTFSIFPWWHWNAGFGIFKLKSSSSVLMLYIPMRWQGDKCAVFWCNFNLFVFGHGAWFACCASGLLFWWWLPGYHHWGSKAFSGSSRLVGDIRVFFEVRNFVSPCTIFATVFPKDVQYRWGYTRYLPPYREKCKRQEVASNQFRRTILQRQWVENISSPDLRRWFYIYSSIESQPNEFFVFIGQL